MSSFDYDPLREPKLEQKNSSELDQHSFERMQLGAVTPTSNDPVLHQNSQISPHVANQANQSADLIVLLLHGLCRSSQELLPVEEALKKVGVRTKSLIIPGYSFEMKQSKQVAKSFEGWIDFVEAEVKKLKKTFKKVVLIGISAGSNVALGVAVKNVAIIDGLVLMSTPLILDGWNIPFYHFLFPLALYTPIGRLWSYEEKPPYGLKNERIRAWVARDLKARRLSSAGASVLEVTHLREHDKLQKHLLKSMSGVSAPPTLVLHASEDEVASLENVRFLQMNWKTPSLHCHVLENSYHMISWDNDRVEVCQKVAEFLEGLK
jgi:carboxylesterase